MTTGPGDGVRPRQLPLLDKPSAAAEWDRNIAKRALDELFTLAHQYRSSKDYWELMRFVAHFRSYSPFNAMLVHIQRPGAVFVAAPSRWLRRYGRRIRAGARPLVILQPMGPVMFVFDVSDTQPEEGAPPLPPEVDRPFEVRCGRVGEELTLATENAKRDGVRVAQAEVGSQSAGAIRAANPPSGYQEVLVKTRPRVECIRVPVRYELVLNSSHSREAQYATLVHEFAHLYCGHLGTPNERWWPDRRWLPRDNQEFEAESVCYLVCVRLGIDNPSDRYLAAYVGTHDETPAISLDTVMKAAALVEQMGRQRLGPRKDDEQ